METTMMVEEAELTLMKATLRRRGERLRQALQQRLQGRRPATRLS